MNSLTSEVWSMLPLCVMLVAELSMSSVVLSVKSLSDSAVFMRAPSMSCVVLCAELSSVGVVSVVGFSRSRSNVMLSVNSSFAGVARLLFVCLNCIIKLNTHDTLTFTHVHISFNPHFFCLGRNHPSIF